jgi:hypothetical protein
MYQVISATGSSEYTYCSKTGFPLTTLKSTNGVLVKPREFSLRSARLDTVVDVTLAAKSSR